VVAADVLATEPRDRLRAAQHDPERVLVGVTRE
jgi:hypothetical protein